MYFNMLHRLLNRRIWNRTAASRSPLDDGIGFTIRFAYPDDEPALRRLAALDSQPLPEAPLLVAEVGGELWAAVTIGGEPRAIADPFRHTAALVALLRERADHLIGQAARHSPPLARPNVAYW